MLLAISLATVCIETSQHHLSGQMCTRRRSRWSNKDSSLMPPHCHTVCYLLLVTQSVTCYSLSYKVSYVRLHPVSTGCVWRLHGPHALVAAGALTWSSKTEKKREQEGSKGKRKRKRKRGKWKNEGAAACPIYV